MRLLALTDRQLQLVKRAAASLPVNAHDGFLQDVARRLADTPSDAAVAQAVNVTLDRVPVFLCDALPKKETTI